MPDLAGKLYWLGERLRGRSSIRERLEWLDQVQCLGAGEIAQLQQQKLSAIISHVYKNVPYYQRVFAERGLTPGDITEIPHLQKLPTLDRSTLLSEQGSLIAENADFATLTENFSSGTTGRRASFKQDENFRLWMRAHQLRTYKWCGGWKVGERFALLWGSEMYWKMKSATDRFLNLLSNRKEFNTFRLSGDFISKVVDSLERFDPVLISSYSNALHLVSRELERKGIRLNSTRAVQATSEATTPEMRERLKRTFNCEVYDKYGSRETNIIAHESPDHDGMFVQSENVVVEILRDDDTPAAPGETGRLVVTTLNNFSMPLIRYEMNDMASWILGHSDTSFQFPRISEVAGRLQDLIVTPDGEFLDAYFFSFLFMRLPAVDWFQVIQESIDELRILVVARDGLQEDWQRQVRERIGHHTKCSFRIRFEVLNQMPESTNGKFRLCISEVDKAQFVRKAVEGA